MDLGVVTDNRRLCDEHYELRLSIDGQFRALPGQFVQVLCRNPHQPAASPPAADAPLLRRAFSVAALHEKPRSTELVIILRVVGPGTFWLSQRRPGDAVSILGPLGNTFTLYTDTKLALLIAGGVGHPPLLMLAHELRRRSIERVALHGVQSAQLLPLTLHPTDEPPAGRLSPGMAAAEWAASDTPHVLATDDGSRGYHGTVVQALEAYRTQQPFDAASTAIYACGPTPMLTALTELAAAWRVRLQVSLEAPMACGMGTCQSCVVKVRDPAARDGWRFGLCCTEGPVFDAARIIW